MKVLVIKKIMDVKPEEKVTNNTNSKNEATEFVKNMRQTNEGYFTSEDIKNSFQFNKARAIRALIMDMMTLTPITSKNENIIDKNTFEAYVEAGNRIDKYFENLMNEFIENYDSDDCDRNCNGCDELALCGKCSAECDIECGHCEYCEKCEEESFDIDDPEDNYDNCDDCSFAQDCVSLVHIFKDVFCFDNVNDTDDISLDLTGEEYNRIKEILDRYEIEEETETNEGSNT